MPKSKQQIEFIAQIRSGKRTLHQLRMNLQRLPKQERFGALLLAFTDTANSQTVFADQEIAGRLLVDLMPACPQALESTLVLIAPSWNVSVEQLPLYLAATHGKKNVVDAATSLAENYPNDSRESNALSTVAWWLTGSSHGG